MRLTTYPIEDQNLWNIYKKALSCFWTIDEVNLARDSNDFSKLNEQEKRLIEYILGFFVQADTLININISDRFLKDFNGNLEVKYFYNFQEAVENIHAEMYSELINTIIVDNERKKIVFNAAIEFNSITKINEFIENTTLCDEDINIRLFKIACIEGLVFTGCFAIIYWFKNRNLMPGLCHSNELIARDEALHTLFALNLIDTNKLPDIDTILNEIVNLSYEFIIEMIPKDLTELNKNLMLDHIKFKADEMLSHLHLDPKYNVLSPFTFASSLILPNKTNFFEKKISDYSRSINKNIDNFDIDYDV